MSHDGASIAQEIVERVARAAEELAQAAAAIPSCDCEQLAPNRMAQVLFDLGKAEAAAGQVHSAFRELQKRHAPAPRAMASLEVR